MLVAVSGMVGSGKSTIANRVVDLAAEKGLQGRTLRFQTLPCFSILRSRRRPAGKKSGAGAVAPAGAIPDVRWSGYRRKRLTAFVALAYLGRIVAFQVYRRFWRSDRVHVLNRYFYDLFAHYTLATPLERLYVAVLRMMMPVPDLAILVVAGPRTITERRPGYSSEYLEAVWGAYTEMRRRFPELIELRTDPGEPTAERLLNMTLAGFNAVSRRKQEPPCR